MTTEELYDHLSMLRYFWQDKEDIERYCSWEEILPTIDKKRPDVVEAWKNYKRARAVLNAVMENL